MEFWLLLLGIANVTVMVVWSHIQRGREIAELRDQLHPFAEITSAAINFYESRRDRHNIMAELQAENNLIAKVKELLKLETP